MEAGQAVRVDTSGGEANVSTGMTVLDRLLELAAHAGGFGLALELAPDEPEAEVDEAARAFGRAFAPLLRAEGARGFGDGTRPADEALALVVLEAADEPLVASNVDLTSARIGGLRSDIAARFLGEFAETAGLVLHVRLIEGDDSQHVLEAIFKALGVALGDACAPRRREGDG